MRGFGTKWAMVLLTCLVFASLSTRASQVRPMNLEKMTQRATTIFAGVCTGVETQHDATLGRPVARVSFRVDQVVKGAAAATLTIRLLGNAAGVPRFREGEETVLFLYGESALGLTSPVGLGQGKFRVVEDKSGRKIAINEFGNDGLLDGLSQAARSTLERLDGRNGAAIEQGSLIQMIELLKH
jgi:hypothetical protein